MEEKKTTAPSKTQNLITGIVVKTITRNANDSKEEFFDKLKVDDKSLDENKVVAGMLMNALIEITKQLLSIEISLNQATGIMSILLTEDEKEQIEKGV